jgi:hypothetical protein
VDRQHPSGTIRLNRFYRMGFRVRCVPVIQSMTFNAYSTRIRRRSPHRKTDISQVFGQRLPPIAIPIRNLFTKCA